MGLGIAIRAFSAALFDSQAAERIRVILEGDASLKPDPRLPAPQLPAPQFPAAQLPAAQLPAAQLPAAQLPAPKSPPAPTPKPARSDAISLLSALQREARMVDLIQEDLANFSDAQVGAAARPCLLQCRETLGRLLRLGPVSDASEGSTVDVGSGGSPSRYQWIGEGTSSSGKLVHQGWQAGQVELPEWTGDRADANVIAPAQLQRSTAG